MSTRPRPARAMFYTLLACCLLVSPVASQAQEKEKKKTTIVGRYLAHKEKFNYQGKKVLLLGIEPVGGGKPMELIVANHDWNKPDYNPVVNTDHVNALGKGDTIKLELDDSKPRPLVRYLKKYDLKAGEEDPGTYVFENHFPKTEGRTTYTAVVLSKFDQFTTVAVPQKKDKDGESGPDENIMAVVGSLKTGEVVEADIRDGGRVPMLTAIEKYTPPQTARFLKMAEADVEGQKAPAVELERDGKPLTAVVEGELRNKKWVSDAKVLAAAKKLKADTEVVCRIRETDGKVWLKEIKPAPVQREEKATASTSGESDEKDEAREGRRARRNR
jgi:hypothetical protein